MIDRRLFSNFDWTLYGIVVLISIIGIVNIYSASSYQMSGTPFFIKQIYWVLGGLVMSVLICSIKHLR